MMKKVVDCRKGVYVMPCPFCGEKEEIYLEEYETPCGNRWRIVCANCMCMIDRGYDQEPSYLIDSWNTRMV